MSRIFYDGLNQMVKIRRLCNYADAREPKFQRVIAKYKIFGTEYFKSTVYSTASGSLCVQNTAPTHEQNDQNDILLLKTKLNGNRKKFGAEYNVHRGISKGKQHVFKPGTCKFVERVQLSSFCSNFMDHVKNFDYVTSTLERRRASIKERFLATKIVMLRFMQNNRYIAVLDEESIFFNDSYCIVYQHQHQHTPAREFDETFALGLLNSNVIQFLLYNEQRSQKFASDIQVADINGLPLPEFNLEFVTKVKETVRKLIDGRKRRDDIDESVAELNKLVYSLYNLTDEEVKLVESVIPHNF